jgi:hypothetical protein
MKILTAIFLLAALSAARGDPEPAIPYFKEVRAVSITAPDHQSYLVIDSAIWSHARPDLADLRLYDGETQVPYELSSRNNSTTAQEDEAKILNLAQRGDHTEFDLDVSAATEYNRVRLTLDKNDFLVTASVSGRNQLADTESTAWPTPSTLFDFSRERLGSNSTITLPDWSFRFLHVRLSPGILPKEVSRATIGYLQEKKAVWADAGNCKTTTQEKRNTIIHCDIPTAVPIDRIRFDVPADPVNFRRMVSVANEKGIQITSGSIGRLRMTRYGNTVTTEDLALNVSADYTGSLTVTIDNGDDPPLPFRKVQPQSLERRLYFEPQGKTALKLYYGDEKLTTPVYDYAKFFREDPYASPAQLAPETPNAAYTGRPDERPWSERHKSVLWTAMLLAVALLGWLAFRGLQAEPTST